MLRSKLFSPLNIFILLILFAAVTALYVSNVVRVNELLTEIKTLEYTRDSLVSSTNMLRNEVLRLESSDRITSIARDRLSLSQPATAPIVIPLKKD